MSRVREMIERNLGTEILTACLFNGTTEIRARGYRPVPFRNWEIDDADAVAVVRFGPYKEPVTFDRYAIYEGDQPMIVIPEYGTARFPRGFTWEGNSRSTCWMDDSPTTNTVDHLRRPRLGERSTDPHLMPKSLRCS